MKKATTTQEKREIRRLNRSGLNQKQIAAATGRSQPLISRVLQEEIEELLYRDVKRSRQQKGIA